MKPLYERYVELKNKKAVLNGFTDYGDQWRQKYDTTTFEEEILDMYKPMQSFYEQLHAYVRRKLYEVYGEEVRFIIVVPTMYRLGILLSISSEMILIGNTVDYVKMKDA